MQQYGGKSVHRLSPASTITSHLCYQCQRILNIINNYGRWRRKSSFICY